MANYTMELRELLEDEFFELFDFEYQFYTDLEERRQLFEKKFCDHYYFDEIGFETGARFKHNLKSRLNMVMPKYTQLYESEMRAKGIDFLLNKDLVEEFSRTLSTEGNTSTDSISKSESATSNASDIKMNSATETSSSDLDNGLSNADADKRKTSHNKDNNLTSSQQKDNSNFNQQGNANVKENSKHQTTETTTFTSKGNIGVTSSAELLDKWRKVMINIDEMLIQECEDLFMVIY